MSHKRCGKIENEYENLKKHWYLQLLQPCIHSGKTSGNGAGNRIKYLPLMR